MPKPFQQRSARFRKINETRMRLSSRWSAAFTPLHRPTANEPEDSKVVLIAQQRNGIKPYQFSSTEANKENEGTQFELGLALFRSLGGSLNSELNQEHV